MSASKVTHLVNNLMGYYLEYYTVFSSPRNVCASCIIRLYRAG